MNDNDPTMLRVPHRFHSVDELLATAEKMKPENLLVICEDENGITLMNNCLDNATVNWLLDQAKRMVVAGKRGD